jgi:hypothetical protein
MLTLSLETYDGERYQLPRLLSWTLRYTASVPCDSMEVKCLYDEGMADVLPRAIRFTAAEDGATMLHGVVDAYEITFSEQGLLVTVEGRGMAALLLDNESEAVTYEQAVLSEVLANHVSPYGIAVEVDEDISGKAYSVTSASSQWKALRGFVHRYGGFEPYFRRDGTLVLSPLWGSGETWAVNDDTPILSLRFREQRYGVISEVLICDKVQNIQHSVYNQAFVRQGGSRRHVLYMPRSTADLRRYTGSYQIAQSALEQVEITLALPFSFAAFPGDRAALELSRLGERETYEVVEAVSSMDGDGEQTTLTLSVRE